jgi:hypothetical protein
VEGKKAKFQAMASYCIDVYGKPEGAYYTEAGDIGFGGKFPLGDFPYPKDGKSWNVTNTREMMLRLCSSHQAGTGHYTIPQKVTMVYTGAFAIANGLPVMAHWRLSTPRQEENGLYTLRIDLGYTVVEPVLRAYFATPRNADGTHNPYGLHHSVVSYTDLSQGLAELLYRHTSIKDFLENQLIGVLTKKALVTLRFTRMDLTGSDGCPLAFSDGAWCAAIKRVTKGPDLIYEDIIATNPGKALVAESKKGSKYGPQIHLSTQHLMLHLHQSKIYGSTDAKVDMLSDVLLRILKRPCYDLACADPTWDEENPNVVKVTTTASGEDCLFPL